MSYEFFIAKRYLKSKQKTGFISIITYISIGGVMIGVAALIIVLSVMNGFESEVRNRIIGSDAHIRLTTYHDQGIEDYGALIQQIRDLPHITGLSPYIFGKGMIKCLDNSDAVFLRGIDQGTIDKVSDLRKNMVLGELNLGSISPEGEKPLPGIVLGRYLADRLIANPGDRVTVISPAGVISLISQPPVKWFRVAGIFETGMYEYDLTFAYISLEAAQGLFRMGDKVSGIEIKLDNLYRADQVKEELDEILGYPYFPQTWFEIHKNLFSWMKIEKWMMFVVLSLIIMVAAFNIISTLIMVVLEKKKEIGILKSMGATSRGVMKIFMFEGLVVGLVGTVLGLMVGYGICWAQQTFKFLSLPTDVYIISYLPVLMKPSDFVFISLASVFLCFVASIYPANKAAQLVPVQAIRYE